MTRIEVRCLDSIGPVVSAGGHAAGHLVIGVASSQMAFLKMLGFGAAQTVVLDVVRALF